MGNAKKKSTMKIIPGLIAIIFTILFLYWPLTKYYFFQDDFILLDIAQSTKSWTDAFHFSDVIFWRPLAVQGYFNLALHFFGLQPFFFHLTSLIFLIINAILVWLIVARVTKSTTVGWLTGFLFGTSSTHFMSQIWVGEFPILLGMFFSLCSIFLCLLWIEHSTWKKTFAIVFFYGCGLLSHELVVLFPLFLLGAVFSLKQSVRLGFLFLRQRYFMILVVFLPFITYLLFRLFIFPIPAHGTYAFQIGKDAIKAIWWYFLWMLNLPEELKYQSFFPFYFRPEFSINFPWQVVIWTWQPVLLLLLGIVIPFVFFLRTRSLVKSEIMFAILWMLAGGGPLLFALGHQYPFLLMFALPGFCLFLTIGLCRIVEMMGSMSGQLYNGIFLVVWLSSSAFSLQFTQLTHWTIQEANRAQSLIQSARNEFRNFPPNSTVIIPGDRNGQNKASLADQLGMKIIFGEPTLKTYYGQLQGVLPVECVTLLEPNLTACLEKHVIFRVKQ